MGSIVSLIGAGFVPLAPSTTKSTMPHMVTCTERSVGHSQISLEVGAYPTKHSPLACIPLARGVGVRVLMCGKQ